MSKNYENANPIGAPIHSNIEDYMNILASKFNIGENFQAVEPLNIEGISISDNHYVIKVAPTFSRSNLQGYIQDQSAISRGDNNRTLHLTSSQMDSIIEKIVIEQAKENGISTDEYLTKIKKEAKDIYAATETSLEKSAFKPRLR